MIGFLRRVGRDNRALVRHLPSGAEQGLGVSTAGVPSNGFELAALLPRDGSRAAFQSTSSNLAAGLPAHRVDSFVKTVAALAALR